MPLCDQSPMRSWCQWRPWSRDKSTALVWRGLGEGQTPKQQLLGDGVLPPGSWVMFAGTEKGDRWWPEVDVGNSLSRSLYVFMLAQSSPRLMFSYLATQGCCALQQNQSLAQLCRSWVDMGKSKWWGSLLLTGSKGWCLLGISQL